MHCQRISIRCDILMILKFERILRDISSGSAVSLVSYILATADFGRRLAVFPYVEDGVGASGVFPLK